ncbi:MAG: gliding motility-associated C-terminal domain-containing protein [Bacteroidetes bacterium]|nr:gliding motility-associated C-terminal domain-containing protein [Bacteroidota bacterium]
MKHTFLGLFCLLLISSTCLGQATISCPAVDAGRDTSIANSVSGCVLLTAVPVAGFQPTTYTVNTIPYNPYPFNVGAPIIINQDDVWGPITNLPFDFCFYGNSYTQAQPGSNGLVSFDLFPVGSYCTWPISAPIPDPSNPLNSIMGPWHDINPAFGGAVYAQLYGTAPCRVFVVSWESNAMFSCTNITTTQQIAIYETTNIIEVYIQDKPLCSTWNGGASILGVHNANGTQAVVVPGHNYPTQWSSINEAWRWEPAGASNLTMNWYQVGNPAVIATTDTVTVCPVSCDTRYVAEATYTNCNGATVTVRDTVLVIGANPNALTNPTVSNALCNGGSSGSITLNPSGGATPYSYNWPQLSQNTATVNGLAAGTYTVIVTDSIGCTLLDTITISEPTRIVPNATATDALCFGASSGSAASAPTGGTPGYTYFWSPSGATAANAPNLPAGQHIVSVTDANGCVIRDTVTVGQPTQVIANTTMTPVLCNGGSTGTATGTAAGGTPGYTFLWSNGQSSATATGLAAGTYSVTATDANGCTGTRSIIVTEPTPVTVTAVSTNVICIGGSDGTGTALGAGGTSPYTFQWSNGSQSAFVNNLSAGTHNVTVTDANGCTATTSITVTEPPQISLQITGDNAYCEYDSLDLQSVVTGGVPPYVYQWWSVPTAVNDSTANLHYYDVHEDRTYNLMITDQNGCQATASYYVESNPQPSVAFTVDRTEICDSGTVVFTNLSGPGPLTSFWEFGDGSTLIAEAPFHWYGTGTYTVSLDITDLNGCTNSMTQELLIEVIPTPVASFVTDPNITLIDHLLLSEATITFNSTSSWFTSAVDWSFGDSTSAFVGQVVHTYQDTGRFCITLNAYNKFGCHDDSTQCITILQDPYLWVPTGFTPNGDGLNDIFIIGGIEIKEFEMWVYDRWGKMLFYTDNMTEGWNGKIDQEDASEGVYVFRINAVNNEGFKMERAGSVTLVR